MDDLRDWPPEPNGPISEEGQLSPVSSPSSRTVISSRFWMRAEEATACIIGQVQPTVISELRRNAVIKYVQRLIKTTLGCEVYPFGSVPLKTYLPDGDIDLTAFGALHAEEALANEVFSVLEMEGQNDAAQFVVKDVKLIRAEVKLVKCLVQNIVVDISVNQLGGLCALCFLERVDGLIGKDHLFKRSIILIKAWCYYESRILGAHHGLISTYALETLVLYIFHLFHTSLDGPLAVLYKFLDYFSTFDWDNYGISLNGPVRLSSLPELVVETLENGGGDLLLSGDFLKECLEIFSPPSVGVETTSRRFPPKHLNIVDPLKENNNLGRSVNKGNFYRIRSAFTYGSRKLGHLLSGPEENIAGEILKFFSNTLNRHGSRQRPDVQDLVPVLRYNRCDTMSPVSVEKSANSDSCHEDLTMSDVESAHPTGNPRNGRYHQRFWAGFDKLKVSGLGNKINVSLETNVPSLSEKSFVGDAKDLATTSIQQLAIEIDSANSSTNYGESAFPMSRPFLPLHHVRNGETGHEMKQPNISSLVESKAVSDIGPTSDEPMGITTHSNGYDIFLASPKSLSPIGSVSNLSCARPQEDASVYNSRNGVTTNLGGGAYASNLLSDLRGDYKNQINSLQYGRWWFDYVQNFHIGVMSPPVLSQVQSSNSWDIVRRALPFRRNRLSPTNANGVVSGQVFFPLNSPIAVGTGFGMEEMPKPRGTGTYFPDASHFRDRPFSPRGRDQHLARSPRNNGHAMTHSETNWSQRISREPESYGHQGDGRCVSSDVLQPPEEKELPSASGSMPPPDSVLDFQSISHPSLEPLFPDSSKQPDAGLGFPSPIPVAGMHQDRIAAQAYHLKDEDDFPPLSV